MNSIDRDCIFVPVKAIESWFIAHLDVIRKTTDKKFPDVNDPENKEILPWDRIKKICVDNKIRGPGFSKLAFSKRMIRNGFCVVSASQHPHLESAKLLVSAIKLMK